MVRSRVTSRRRDMALKRRLRAVTSGISSNRTASEYAAEGPGRIKSCRGGAGWWVLIGLAWTRHLEGLLRRQEQRVPDGNVIHALAWGWTSGQTLAQDGAGIPRWSRAVVDDLLSLS